MSNYETLWYLSFVSDDDEFLGVSIVNGNDPESAVASATEQDCHPGGAVLAMPIPPDEAAKVPSGSIGRLLTKEGVDTIWPGCATLGEIRDEEQN